MEPFLISVRFLVRVLDVSFRLPWIKTRVAGLWENGYKLSQSQRSELH